MGHLLTTLYSNMRVNRIEFSKIKLQWQGRLASAFVFKGVQNYEDYMISKGEEEVREILERQNPFEEMNDVEKWLRGDVPPTEGQDTPEGFYRIQESSLSTGGNEKDRLWNRAVMLRKQIDDAVASDNFEKAQLLKDTLDIIEKKYNEL